MVERCHKKLAQRWLLKIMDLFKFLPRKERSQVDLFIGVLELWKRLKGENGFGEYLTFVSDWVCQRELLKIVGMDGLVHALSLKLLFMRLHF